MALTIGLLLSLLVGVIVGFVVNVVATRLARSRPLFGPLRCTRSPHALQRWQGVPIVGYVRQRGRCAVCGESLSLSFPLVEIGTAAVFAILFLLEGWGLSFLFHAVYSALLILVLVVDWKHKEIYLHVIAAGLLISLVGSLVLPGIDLVSALTGAGVAGAFFFLAFILAKIIFPKVEEPLGAGDVYLALMMGTMLGFPNVVGALLIGPLLAGASVILLLVTRRNKLGDLIPYGVSLCFATLLFLLYPAPFADALNLPALKALMLGLFS